MAQTQTSNPSTIENVILDDQKGRCTKVPQFVAGYAAAMGAFTTGVCVGWSSGGLAFIREMRGEKPEIDSWIVSIANLGACFSLLFTPLVMERFGRKGTLIAPSPLCALCFVVLAFVHEDNCFIAMRFVMGFGMGCYGVVSPVYSGEVAQTRVRGALGYSFEIMLSSGIVYSYCISLLPNFMWYNLASIIPVIVFVIWMSYMPETPYFLLKIWKTDDSKEVLQWLRGKKCNIEEEFKDIAFNVRKGLELKKATLKDLATKKHLRRAMGMSLLLIWSQQLSGIAVVVFNMHKIFGEAASGHETLTPQVQSIIAGSVRVIMASLGMLVVDRIGRRLLMMLSLLVMCTSHMGLFAYFFVKEANGDETARRVSWLPLLCLVGLLAGYSLGTGPIPWATMGELYAAEAKAISATVTILFSWTVADFCNDMDF